MNPIWVFLYQSNSLNFALSSQFMQMESLGDQISIIGDFDHNISIMYSREIRVSKSQWGSLSQAMAKKDIKIQKLVRTNEYHYNMEVHGDDNNPRVDFLEIGGEEHKIRVASEMERE